MSESNFLAKLKALDFRITPGALEVMKNSHVPLGDLIADIQKFWEEEERIITVKKAINLMVRSQRDIAISREVVSEIKAREKYIPVPRQLRRTYTILKRFEKPVTAGYIARITHRKMTTEEIYLNQLVKLGFVTEIQKGNEKKRYQIGGKK